MLANVPSRQQSRYVSSTPTQDPTPSNPFVTTFQLSKNSSDYSPFLISPVTDKTAFVVGFTQRNDKPPLSQIFNYTGTNFKPILPQPMNGTVPSDIVYDRVLDRVWFLAGENLSYYDSRLNTTVTEHTFAAGDTPTYMAIDHNARIWLTLPFSNRVARYDPFNKQFNSYTALSPEAEPWGITVGPDDSVWFAEPNGTKIGHIVCQESPCIVSEFTAPPEIHVASLVQVTVASDGTVWFTDHGAGEFGSFNSSTHEWKLFPIGYCSEPYNLDCPIGLPNKIAFDSNGKLWFAEHVAGRVAEYDPSSQRLTEYIVPATIPPYVWWMQPGPGNLVWFTAFGLGKIGYVNASEPVSIFVNASATVQITQGRSQVVSASVLSSQGPVLLNLSANGNDAPFGLPAQLYGHYNGGQIGPSTSLVNSTLTVTTAWNLLPGDRYIALTAYNGIVQVSTFVRVHVVAQYYLALTLAPILGLGSVSTILVGASSLVVLEKLRRKKTRLSKS